MLIIIICLFLSALCFVIGGYCRGIFECVTIMKFMDTWIKDIIYVNGIPYRYWGYELFVLHKDRNSDGKATWLEKTFPNDGGHRIKLLELFYYGLGATFLLCSKISIGWFTIVIPFIIWWLISVGFELSFNKFRYKK